MNALASGAPWEDKGVPPLYPEPRRSPCCPRSCTGFRVLFASRATGDRDSWKPLEAKAMTIERTSGTLALR